MLVTVEIRYLHRSECNLYRKNTAISPRHAHGLHLAVSHKKVNPMSTTTNLRLVPRNPATNHHVLSPAAVKAEQDAIKNRKSMIRMGLAAASAPVLWLFHALAAHLAGGF
jgi:hypothetical protein